MPSWIRRFSGLLVDALQVAAVEYPVALLVSLLLIVATTLVAAFGVQV